MEEQMDTGSLLDLGGEEEKGGADGLSTRTSPSPALPTSTKKRDFSASGFAQWVWVNYAALPIEHLSGDELATLVRVMGTRGAWTESGWRCGLLPTDAQLVRLRDRLSELGFRYH